MSFPVHNPSLRLHCKAGLTVIYEAGIFNICLLTQVRLYDSDEEGEEDDGSNYFLWPPRQAFVSQKPIREVGEEKDQLKSAPGEVLSPDSTGSPDHKPRKKRQDALTPGISSLRLGNLLAEGMESCFCALDQLTTQSYNLFLSGSKADI